MWIGVATTVRARRALLSIAFALSAACGNGGGGAFRQYEYEEEMHVSLDGSATLYVHASVPALNALRGTTFDERPNARVDREAIRRHFSTTATRVTRVSASRRNNRRFYHARMDVDDVVALGSAAPFAWSTYAFNKQPDLIVYRQQVGAGSGATAYTGWRGDEIVAFRLHLPSRVVYHNTPGGVQRGNMLVWEQTLAARRSGEPLAVEARIERRSILYSTLVLFAGAGVAAAASFAIVLWWVRSKGRPGR